MRTFFRCVQADLLKARHTFLPLIHVFVPLGVAALFLGYYAMSNWNEASELSVYFEVIGGAFPIVIGLLCAKAADLEAEAGSFQTLLSSTVSRGTTWLGALFALLLAAAFSVALAVGTFGAGFCTAPAQLYVYAALLLIGGSVFLYILHLFVAFRFGGGASIGLGIAEMLVAFLALTGLGDGVWYYIPCTWGARLSASLVSAWADPGSAVWGFEIRKGLLTAGGFTLLALFLSLVWFSRWEGRKNAE